MIFRNIFSKAFLGVRQAHKRTLHMDSYVWIDLELTGLEVEKDTILEIACLITTPKLDIVHEGLNLVIHQPDETLSSMNSWSEVQHAKTGLTEASRNSKISLASAEAQVADYITQHTAASGVRYLAGNSVYVDRIFLNKHMSKVSSLLHYRLIDVSCIKILSSHWYPDIFAKLNQKSLEHRALGDIKESIKELKNYRALIFK